MSMPLNRDINKIHQLLASIPDGEERYKTSILFRQSFDAYINGSNHIDIINNLCIAAEKTQKDFEEYVRMQPFIYITKKDDDS